jgi:multiple sugar transport system ATP-binding protein
MGRAIVREPNAFLMDEPLSNLDARLRVQMRAEIARIQKMAGVTTIYVTHDQVEAMTMGDRVAVMSHGVLQQLGPPRELYHDPANLFVASFIGSPAINLMESKVVSGNNGPELMLGTERNVLPDKFLSHKPAIEAYVGRTVAVGLRPEALIVGPAAGPEQTTITGTVALTEDLGASLLVHFDVPVPPPLLDGDGIAVDDDLIDFAHRTDRSRLRATVDGFASVHAGDSVPIAINLDRMHLFDRHTGLAIGAQPH